MADTKIDPSPGAEPAAASSPKSIVDRTTGLSEEVLESVEAGQRAAIEAVRAFVSTVDQALPVDSSRRQGVDTTTSLRTSLGCWMAAGREEPAPRE